MGFPGYFLVVADFINWAKSQGIRVGPGRGSAAGSMASYVMGITELDPLQHGLIFERFLNPERVSMPDVDVDFDERRRGEVIKYVTDKYGDDRVSQVVTYGTIKAKQALKDSSRLLGFPFAMGEKLTKAMPPAVMGKDISLGGIFNPQDPRYAEAEQFRQVHSADPEAQRVVELARGIEGLKRQWGVHACALIMSSVPLTNVIPTMRRPQDGAIITQFDYPTSETLGLIKMDFLGLRNLTILDDALGNIVANGKDAVEIEAVALADEAAYALLTRGDTLGVFQLDGGPMRALLRQMRPDNFEDISAVIALYRPGPMGMNSHTNYALRKNGLQEITPIHPELEAPLAEVLGETYGLIVYQEQVQRAAQILAGYSLGQADLLRRAMGKKKKEILDKEFVPFQAGCRERGYSDGAIQAVWDTLVPFAGYAFNKAHSAGYGLVAYWTAFLKANYPTEYMAALLTSVRDDKDKSALYLSECRRMGITVLPPDVNSSAANFTAVGDDIRFGLTGVRNVGANVVDAITATREEKGEFTSFTDFLDKVPAVVCNKRTIESLIKAGAFDSLGHTRRALLAIHEMAVDSVISVKRKEAEGQFDLFADFAAGDDGTTVGFSVDVPDLPDWEKKQRLAFEREMLGLYVSDHPLSGLEHVLSRAAETTIANLLADEERADGSVVTVAGLLTNVQHRWSKNGNPWGSVAVEDLEGSVEVMFFGETYLAYSTILAEDTVVTLRGRVRRRDDAMQLQAMEVSLPDVSASPDGPVTVSLPSVRCTQPVVERLREILRTHPGASEVHLKLTEPGRATVMRLEDTLRVERTPALFGDLKALLGPSCLV
jgi:DNA polymerase-3 subunit alpha